jgi:hypothetical protein
MGRRAGREGKEGWAGREGREGREGGQGRKGRKEGKEGSIGTHTFSSACAHTQVRTHDARTHARTRARARVQVLSVFYCRERRVISRVWDSGAWEGAPGPCHLREDGTPFGRCGGRPGLSQSGRGEACRILLDQADSDVWSDSEIRVRLHAGLYSGQSSQHWSTQLVKAASTRVFCACSLRIHSSVQPARVKAASVRTCG